MIDMTELALAEVPKGAVRQPVVRRHRLSAASYHKMAEMGVLATDARVELIDGGIVDMAPIGSRHYWAVTSLTRLLVSAVGERALLAVQSPLRLDEHNEPEPDLVLLRPQARRRRNSLPKGSDALLVVEVSDTSLSYDTRIKAALYAQHGVAEYWVVDLGAHELLRFSGPAAGKWLKFERLPNPGTIALPPIPGLPGASIDFSTVF